MTATSRSTRFQFDTFFEEPRLVVATGNFRRSPLGRDKDGVQLQHAIRGADDIASSVVNVTRSHWLDGLRYLAVTGVVPIAELALPCTVTDLAGREDPGKLCDEFARGHVEHVRTRKELLAPDSHAVWAALRRAAGQGFYVGWFAGRGRKAP
jgi:hypothetical protein